MGHYETVACVVYKNKLTRNDCSLVRPLADPQPGPLSLAVGPLMSYTSWYFILNDQRDFNVDALKHNCKTPNLIIEQRIEHSDHVEQQQAYGYGTRWRADPVRLPGHFTSLHFMTTDRFNRYEGVHAFVKPHSKGSGQLSGASTEVADSAQDLNKDPSRGQRTAENMRYGQGISEQGTAPSEIEREATDAGVDAGRQEDTPAQSRREQGYYGSNEVKRDVGA